MALVPDSLARAHIHSLPDDLLQCLILTDPPDISRHVNLSAVCRRWRTCLALRRTLSRMYQKDRPSRTAMHASFSAVSVQPSLAPTSFDEPYEGRDRALLAVLSRCVVLESLFVENSMLTDNVLGALGGLPCARTLRSLTVAQDYRTVPVDRILASLPALEVFDIHLNPQCCFAMRTNANAHHSLRELTATCACELNSLIRVATFTELRRLRIHMAGSHSDHPAHVLAGLCAIIPRLETLELHWPLDKNALLRASEAELIKLLGEASTLRELILDSRVNIGEEFVSFASGRLTGLEVLTLRTPNAAAINLLMLLPRLRKAQLLDIVLPDAEPLRLCGSPALEWLRLSLASTQCPRVEIALPVLTLLNVSANVPLTIDCPALEELCMNYFRYPQYMSVQSSCTGATAASLRMLTLWLPPGSSFAVPGDATLHALECLSFRGDPPKELVLRAPKLDWLGLHPSTKWNLSLADFLAYVSARLHEVELVSGRDVLDPLVSAGSLHAHERPSRLSSLGRSLQIPFASRRRPSLLCVQPPADCCACLAHIQGQTGLCAPHGFWRARAFAVWTCGSRLHSVPTFEAPRGPSHRIHTGGKQLPHGFTAPARAFSQLHRKCNTSHRFPAR